MCYVFVLRGWEIVIENLIMIILGLSSLRYKYGGIVIFKGGFSFFFLNMIKIKRL